MLDESTEPFLALDLARRERQRGRLGFLRLGSSFRQRNIADTLMRAFFVVMFEKLFRDVLKMFLAKNDKMI